MVREKQRMSQLTFPEFVYFLCRLTEAHYEDTQYEDEDISVKFDNLLVHLLDPFDLQPMYRIKAHFSVDHE